MPNNGLESQNAERFQNLTKELGEKLIASRDKLMKAGMEGFVTIDGSRNGECRDADSVLRILTKSAFGIPEKLAALMGMEEADLCFLVSRQRIQDQFPTQVGEEFPEGIDNAVDAMQARGTLVCEIE